MPASAGTSISEERNNQWEFGKIVGRVLGLRSRVTVRTA